MSSGGSKARGAIPSRACAASCCYQEGSNPQVQPAVLLPTAAGDNADMKGADSMLRFAFKA